MAGVAYDFELTAERFCMLAFEFNEPNGALVCSTKAFHTANTGLNSHFCDTPLLYFEP